jgi:hypothetical protein
VKDITRPSDASVASTSAIGFEFLRTELQIANTMLDLADVADDVATYDRRRARAVAARVEVERRLAPDAPRIGLNEKQREELSASLRYVSRRLGPSE